MDISTVTNVKKSNGKLFTNVDNTVMVTMLIDV